VRERAKRDRAARVERVCRHHEIPPGDAQLGDQSICGANGARYRKSMKISRWLVALFLTAPTSLFAVDELALRLEPALEAITPDGLLAHIKVLASDEFEGRAPGTKGEELSVKYITDQFKKIGLQPGNPDRTYTQEVSLAGIKSEPRMSFVAGDKTIDLKYPRRLHSVLRASSTGNQDQQFGSRLRRVRHRRTGIRMGRLQKCRCLG